AFGSILATFVAAVASAAVGLAALATLAIAAALAASALRFGCSLCFGCFLDRRSAGAAQPTEQAFEQARAFGGGSGHGGCWGRRDGNRGRLCGRDALDQSLGTMVFGVLVLVGRPGELLFGLADQLYAALAVFQTWVVVTQALDVVVGRFKILVGDQDEIDLEPCFELGDVGPLFVQQEG